jgi:hypothetical protein
MTSPVRAEPLITQMRRGQLPAVCCRHVRVDGLKRPSGRNASPSGTTPSTIMSPARSHPGSRTEIRLGARAHTTPTANRAHAPPTPATVSSNSQDHTLDPGPQHR